MPGPLSGIRVLELARILAGPWAGQTLADLGAEVIKVERPGAGDDTRGWGPPFMEASDGSRLSSAYNLACNRGKRSIAIDFETEAGQRVVKKLAARSDVVLENFKVGGLAKYGLDYQSLAADNPRLVYCSITGFGQDGPYAHRAGYDLLVQGMSGIMDVTGPADGEPMRLGVAFADVITGVYSALAVTAALKERERTGRGSTIDMALLDTMVGVLANQALFHLVSGTPPKRMGNAHPAVVPYQTFPCSDGHVLIACGNDSQFGRMMEVLGAPEMAKDERYATNATRVVNRETLIPRLYQLTAKFTRAELTASFEKVGVPAGPINTIADAFADPQVMARGMRIDRPHPAAKGGSIPGVRSPMTINGRRAAADRAQPRLGEHTQEILREIGEG
jgi:crotonobetainyl-CoA:carnitine CoA-transferase CaiB-like acyl-CoA transferase